MAEHPETEPNTGSVEPDADSVARIEQAFDAGNWRLARSLAEQVDPSKLDDPARARFELVEARTGSDKVAIGIAVVIGVGYLVILALLYL